LWLQRNFALVQHVTVKNKRICKILPPAGFVVSIFGDGVEGLSFVDAHLAVQMMRKTVGKIKIMLYLQKESKRPLRKLMELRAKPHDDE